MAQYAVLVASVMPGSSFDEINDNLALAVGLQLRSVALTQRNVRVVTPGGGITKELDDILGDHAADWIGRN